MRVASVLRSAEVQLVKLRCVLLMMFRNDSFHSNLLLSSLLLSNSLHFFSQVLISRLKKKNLGTVQPRFVGLGKRALIMW
jgi:hypothetical protein